MSPAKYCWSALCGMAIGGAALAADEPAGVGVPTAPTAGDEADAQAAPAATAPENSPARQYAAAYETLARADMLKKKGLSDQAREAYRQAHTLFQQLSAAHPLWETNVVAFRINYCADALARLPPTATPAVGAVSTTASRPALVSAAAVPESPPPPAAAAAPPAGPERAGKPADMVKVTAYLHVALQKERAADMKSALENYLTALEEQPQNREALKGVGRCCLRAGLLDDARDYLQRGISLPDPDAEMNLLMALVYCRNKEFYKAYQLLLIALNEQPDNALARLAMGVAQAGLNQLDQARVETQKAIQMDPNLGAAHYNLARITFKLKPASPGLAGEYYRNALRHGAAPDPELAKQLPP